MTVSRRVSPKAVVRNRFKRQIRDTFRHDQAALAGLDIVVVVRPAALNLEPIALRDTLRQHWNAIRKSCRSSSSS